MHEDYEPFEPNQIFVYRLKCELKPVTFFKVLTESSRFPKFYLEVKDECLILNGEYLLRKLNFDSSNYHFIRYALRHPNHVIRKEQIEKRAGKAIDTKFLHILQNLKIDSELRKIFFPKLTANSAIFRPSVMVNEMVDIKHLNVQKLKQNLQKLSRI